MAWSFTDLKYGWKIAAGISLAAVTIYVATNERERVNQADIIELALGTTERCLATQYSTNPILYYVDPPSYVRSWYSNSYETTNVPGDPATNWTAVLHTNIYTNAIGWRTDRAKAVARDATMRDLPPYYTTNSPGRYTSSVPTMTVTGIFASLQIGDKTNKFTQTPASGTNAATYGEYPWRIYKLDLEERYKFLYSLQNLITTYEPSDIYGGTDNEITGDGWGTLYGWYIYGTSYGGQDTNIINGMRDPPTFSELRTKALSYWGSASGHHNDSVDTYTLNGVDYWEYFYVSSSTTNAATNVRKVIEWSDTGFYWSWEPEPGNYWGMKRQIEIGLQAATEYKKYLYTNLSAIAESTNMFEGRVIVTITGDDGGGTIPGEITDDDGSADSWADLSISNSPYLAYSNSFKSLLEVDIGDLDAPTVLGSKYYSISISQGPIRDVVTSGGGYGVTNIHFQDLSSNWYDKFSYATNKYW